jgi:hypothetical protein
MDNFRYRPKDNYIHKAQWNELLTLIKYQKNELTFYKFDLKYLQQLIDIHYVKLLVYENSGKFQDLQNDLKTSLVQCDILLKRILLFITHFNTLISEPYAYDSKVLRGEFELFDDDYSDCIETVKIIRLLAFTMLKNILEEEKPHYLWKFN